MGEFEVTPDVKVLMKKKRVKKKRLGKSVTISPEDVIVNHVEEHLAGEKEVTVQLVQKQIAEKVAILEKACQFWIDNGN